MATGRNVIKNSGFIFTAKIVSKVFLVALFIIIARTVGVIGIGAYAYAFSLAGIFVALANFGVPQLMVRSLAREPQHAAFILQNLLVVRSIIFCALFALYGAGIHFLHFGKNYDQSFLLLVGAGVFVQFFSLAPRALFTSFEKLGFESLLMVMEAVLLLMGGIIVYAAHFGLRGFGLSFVLTETVVVVVSLVWVKKHFIPSGRQPLSLPFCRTFYRRAIPFAIMGLFSIAYSRFDTILLAVLRSEVSVGLYSAAHKVLEAPIFIPMAVATALYPVFVRIHKEQGQRLAQLFSRVYKVLLAVGFAIAIFTTLSSTYIIQLLCGSGFEDAAPTLMIIIWVAVMQFGDMLLGTALYACDKEWEVTGSIVVCTILNIVVNLLAIPRLSHNGAALALLLSEVASFGLQAYFAHRYAIIRWPQLIGPLCAMCLLAAAVLAPAFLLCRDLNPLIAAIATGSFLASLLLFRIVPRTDIDYIIRQIQRNKLNLSIYDS